MEGAMVTEVTQMDIGWTGGHNIDFPPFTPERD
jgi:hypothetical protein